MRRALVREIGDSFANALSAHPPASPIEVALARVHHAEYVTALERAGVAITWLSADEAFPDGVFVEDTAVIANGLALITRPGAPSRRGETTAVADALARHLEIVRMAEPATLDGGDVLRVGSRIHVGRSARTNAAGIAELRRVFSPRGFTVVEVDLPARILHLKCACTAVRDHQIVLAEHTVPAATFGDVDVLWVPAHERYAANVVAVDDHVLVARGHPATAELLARAGFQVHEVGVSEVQKADGSLTCQSLVF